MRNPAPLTELTQGYPMRHEPTLAHPAGHHAHIAQGVRVSLWRTLTVV